MAGTSAGAKKAVKTNLKKDPSYYSRNGKKGGEKSSTGGFASLKVGPDGLTGPQRAKVVGYKSGYKSKETKNVEDDVEKWGW